MGGGWRVGGRETSAESHERVKAGESEEGRPQRRVRNGWRLGSRRKRVLSGESGMGGGWGVGMGGGWRVRNGDLSVESGMGKGWGVGGRETSAECQEWLEAGESEEGRPQRRVRNGWRLGSQRKRVLSGESGMGGGWGVGMGGGWRVRNGWRLGSRRKGVLSGKSGESGMGGGWGVGMGGGWRVGGRETSVDSPEWVKAGESEEWRPQQRVRNGWRLGNRRN
ncbi:hypothetical protein NDU88_003737 [Pleurodeles waltl]|uniref:Uncharacterized protein n=1 Tax=Pleurodeles waltl TaxID=8319 RepID=A0AAV7KYX0_PLEWA|nr:hypothetical protein NDU88_003737 [Pleurodeles waltl]